MSEFETLFPLPRGTRNADDMGMPPAGTLDAQPALLAGVALTWWSLTGPRLHRAAQLYRTRGLRYTLASAWREAGRHA